MAKVSNYQTADLPIVDGSFIYIAYQVAENVFVPRKVAIEDLLAQINSVHEEKANPHPQYATGGAQDNHSGRDDNPHGVTAAQVGADPVGTAAGAVSAHEAASNPHPQYEEAGAVDAHAASPDPHTQYAKKIIDWFEISGNTALVAADTGKSADITANADIALPTLAAAGAGFTVELVPDGALTVNLVPDGAETVRGGKTVITGPAVVTRSRDGSEWIVFGSAEAP